MDKYTVMFVLIQDDGHMVKHIYEGLNEVEATQQLNSMNKVILDLIHGGSDDTLTVKVWKEE